MICARPDCGAQFWRRTSLRQIYCSLRCGYIMFERKTRERIEATRALRAAEREPPSEPRAWMTCYCGARFRAGEGDGLNCSVGCSDAWVAGGWFDLGEYERRTARAVA